MTVLITLSAGLSTGPFDIYDDVDGYSVAIEVGVPRASLVSGFTTSNVRAGATTILVVDTSVCATQTYLPIGVLIPPCSEGMDIVFLVDYTGSMGSAINGVKATIATIASTIVTESNNNYRLGLVLFDEYTSATVSNYSTKVDYTNLPIAQRVINTGAALKYQWITAVEMMQTNNQSTFTDQLNILNTSLFPLGNGQGTPEPSDMGVDLISNDEFAGAFRAGVSRIIILITDAAPSGNDDTYNATDITFINNLIPQVASKGIRVLLMTTAAASALDTLAIGTGGLVSNGFSGAEIITAIEEICTGTTGNYKIQQCTTLDLFNTTKDYPFILGDIVEFQVGTPGFGNVLCGEIVDTNFIGIPDATLHSPITRDCGDVIHCDIVAPTTTTTVAPTTTTVAPTTTTVAPTTTTVAPTTTTTTVATTTTTTEVVLANCSLEGNVSNVITPSTTTGAPTTTIAPTTTTLAPTTTVAPTTTTLSPTTTVAPTTTLAPTTTTVAPTTTTVAPTTTTTTVATAACDIESLTYLGVNLSVGAQAANPYDTFFKSDGLKAYVLGVNTDTIFQYTLGTPWEINTATYDNISFAVGSQESSPTSIEFDSSGSKMFVLGFNSKKIHQYTLTTPWDLSTATYDNASLLVSAMDSVPMGIHFKPDGLKLYLTGYSSDRVFQYTLGTPWSIATATYDNVSFYMGSQDNSPRNTNISSDGSTMFMVGIVNKRIYQYSLSTPWNVATATYSGVNFLITEATSPIGMHINGVAKCGHLYVTDYSTGTIFQYTM